jgi:transcription antitermination factor NusG
MPNLAPKSEAHVSAILAAQTNDWYALQTRARFERRICHQIQNKHYEAYVPLTKARHRWSDRYQMVETPIFPGYVFVRATENTPERLAILQTSGVYCFVSFNGVIGRITDQQVSDLRRLESYDVPWSQYPFLKSGRRVRIVGGCLDGLEGIFIAERGHKLVISIEPMQRSIALDVEGYHLEPV